jgi:hypothetical protein
MGTTISGQQPELIVIFFRELWMVHRKREVPSLLPSATERIGSKWRPRHRSSSAPTLKDIDQHADHLRRCGIGDGNSCKGDAGTNLALIKKALADQEFIDWVNIPQTSVRKDSDKAVRHEPCRGVTGRRLRWPERSSSQILSNSGEAWNVTRWCMLTQMAGRNRIPTKLDGVFRFAER